MALPVVRWPADCIIVDRPRQEKRAMPERKKILVVDDSKTAQMMTALIVRKADFEVSTASDGEEGLQKALSERPDIILMDVMMPKMDGFEACRRLHDHEETKTIPVIMVTTRGEVDNIEVGYSAGCVDYVTKPVNSVELLAKLRNHLQR
jgi:DNA-binding response OmpR family regulator